MQLTRSGLEHLFGSDTRLKLLRIFLHHPEESFYVRELVRRLGTQIHAVRRELMNLERLGVIQAAEDAPGDPTDRTPRGPLAQRKYFRAETKHLLYPELKALIVKADLLKREDLVRRLKAAGTITLLILTGRFIGAAGASTDMLVVGLVNKRVLRNLILECEREFGHEVNYTVLTPREFKYRKEVTDRFLYEILEGKKIVLIDAMAESALRRAAGV
jgi:hypothetical protein